METLSKKHSISPLIGHVLKTMGPNWPLNLFVSFRGLSFLFRGAINLPGKGKEGPKEKSGHSVGK